MRQARKLLEEALEHLAAGNANAAYVIGKQVQEARFYDPRIAGWSANDQEAADAIQIQSWAVRLRISQG